MLAIPLVLASLVTGYVRLELAEPEPFADRAVRALRSEEVRAVIAEQVAVEMLERGSPDLVASRPLVLTAVEAVLETEEFARVLRRTAVGVHELLLRGERDVIVELEEAREVLVPAVRAASPEVARQIPSDLRPRIAEIRGSDVATSVVRVADSASAAALPLLIGAVAALGLAVALAADRRRASGGAGLALAVAGGLGLAAMAALRAQALSHAERVGVLSEEDARGAAGATWEALAGGLEGWLVITAIAGLALAAGALLAEARIDRRAALRLAAEIVSGGALPRPVRALRGLGMTALGALILLQAEPIFATVVVVVGGTLVLLGLAETLSTAGGPPQTARPHPRRRHRAATAAVAALILAGGGAVALITRGGAPAPPAEEEITDCNGLAELCDRRLDESVFPGTHNSMAAADRPGWFFANQTRPIPRQLEDGIRLLMIDPHYGVVDAQGRVRTDLQAEGTSRNRVARRLGTGAVRAAERLAGRLGLVPAEGEREIFLCHTLCELGAERMSSTLDEIRGFLERNPSEVLIVFVESSVDPPDVEREFDRADLEPYLAPLRRGDPLPTLREMIASGRRLVVLDEGDGGDASWFHPGFVFVQDTRIRALLRSRTACDPNRGTPESPMFLINHWIDRFPPSPSENGEVSDRRTLMRRIRSCRERHDRAPNLIAVDFYERGEVLAVSRTLNISGAARAPRRHESGGRRG
jgi:hypothetical protein